MTRILRMRGIPFSATEEDIQAFFSAWGLEDVRICKKSGRPTGEAYVKFKTEKGCAEAMSARDKEKLGKRYVELFKAKDQDLEQRPTGPDVISKGHVLRMRGLPFSASVADILQFFEDIPSVDHDNVLFVYDSSGRPSGEAYVYFTDEEGCKTALKMDKKEMGSRYIELFPTHESDIQRASRLGRLRSGKSENHPPRRQRPTAKAPATTPSKAAKPCEPAEAAPRAIPNYKPVAMKQLTKTFANVAAAPLKTGDQPKSSDQLNGTHATASNASVPGGSPGLRSSSGATGGSGHGGSPLGDAQRDGDARGQDGRNGASVSAIALGLSDKLALAHDPAPASLFANDPMASSAGSLSATSAGKGSHGKLNGVVASGPAPGHQEHQQHGKHDRQVWHQWGEVPANGLSGLPVYDMWSGAAPTLPKVAVHPHDQLVGSIQGGLWQPMFQQAANGASGLGNGMGGMGSQGHPGMGSNGINGIGINGTGGSAAFAHGGLEGAYHRQQVDPHAAAFHNQ